ncbi:TPR-like protein [Mycena vulgaris]|nr:TPR-like protein [Mycena vulgaris]
MSMLASILCGLRGTSKTIYLEDLQVECLSHPHQDLPSDTQIFAHLIVKKHIIFESIPVASEPLQASWKLKARWEVPQNAHMFSIAIIRCSETQGVRLLGSIKIKRKDALRSVQELQGSFHQEVAKINQDGPSLQLKAKISVSDAWSDVAGQSTEFSLASIYSCRRKAALTHFLEKHNTMAGGIRDTFRGTWMIHETILLLAKEGSDRARLLNFLGDICWARWEASHLMLDLNCAVWAYEDAVRDDPRNAVYLEDTSFSLHCRFEQLGEPADLTRSVLLQEVVVSLTPDGHRSKGNSLNTLAGILRTRFEQLGDPDDLSKCLSLQQDAISLIPDGHPDKLFCLNNLANSLSIRFEHLGDPNDLSKSLLLQEDAVSLIPDGHPDKPLYLNNLANSLRIRFERLGDLTDLNKSLSLQEDVVSLIPDGHPDKPLYLNNLANFLRIRFERLGDLTDLNKSLSLQEDAVSLTPDSHPNKPKWLNNCALSLRIRFERLGDLADLSKSLSLQEDAVSLTPDGHAERPKWLTNLALSLYIRFGRLGDLNDLSKSLSLQEDVVSLVPDGHPEKPHFLNNLACSLRRRFDRLGDLNDLRKSLSLQEDSVSLAPDGHPGKPKWLNNLSNSLLTRFERLGDLNDLSKSLSLQENAVSLTPDGHAEKPKWLNNLASSLRIRFERLGDLNDLKKSLSLQEDAVSLTPDGHADKPIYLNTLACSLHIRFEQHGDLNDLSKSLSLQEDVVSLIPDGHPDKALSLNDFANFLHTRFEQLGEQCDLDQMFLHLSSAAQSSTGPTDVRFKAASRWAQAARSAGHPSVLDAYQVALDLLPELAWLGLSISDRHHHILTAGQLVRDAAATAIAHGLPEQAVEWLEQGRSIIWGQFLSLRTPVDDLQEKYPTLANELTCLSTQLAQAGTRGRLLEADDSSAQQSLQSIANQAHANAQKRAELLTQIRQLEGFERFLMPKLISELSPAAQKGPVVILNVASTCCDALVLLPDPGDGVKHIPLPNLTPKSGEDLTESLRNLVPSAARSERLFGKQEAIPGRKENFAKILSELWVQLVKPILDALGIMTTNTNGSLQRVWWCPTGPLTFLPIHAAGLYGKDEPFGSKLSDFVISSYTPSLTALMKDVHIQTESSQSLKVLAVAQPAASGQSYIPGTQEELDGIQLHARGKVSLLRLEEDAATVASVEKGMMESHWVHFACHGVQDFADPTESALFLAGSERLTLSSIIQLSLPRAEFAFLSACQTATGDTKLQEESVHLAAGMLLAGYHGVIATMWTIMDQDAPQVARDVYEHLFKTPTPDPTRAAEALHLAVKKLRENSSRGNLSFSRWVPFIHVGV